MADILDYLAWRGDLSLATDPFNEVDNLVLSQLSYLDLEQIVPGIDRSEERARTLSGTARRLASVVGLPVTQPTSAVTVREASQAFERLYPPENRQDLGPLIDARTNELLGRMASGKRFAAARLSSYQSVFDPATGEQFAALVIELSDGTAYVSFRGTDRSLLGWLEDGEMTYRVVPSQTRALAYLTRVVGMTTAPLRVGGHSKGGNLAAYASASCEDKVAERIKEVWCNDSPGFCPDVIPVARLAPIADKMRLFTPEYSLVASLMEQPVLAQTVKSAGQGVMEHSMLSWQVTRSGIVRGLSRSEGARRVSDAIQEVLRQRDLAGRERLLRDLAKGLDEQHITTVDDVLEKGPQGLAAAVSSMDALTEEDRQLMNDVFAKLVGGAVSGVVTDTVMPAARRATEAFGKQVAEAGKSVGTLVMGLGRGGRGEDDTTRGEGDAGSDGDAKPAAGDNQPREGTHDDGGESGATRATDAPDEGDTT